MDEQKLVSKLAKDNYSVDKPWPSLDPWHNITNNRIHKKIKKWFKAKVASQILILNAGSGGTDYNIGGSVTHLDIVDSYIKKYLNYIVASIENMPCEDNYFDIVICVGSVLNYADVFLSIQELTRILKPTGILILEFERSNSAEFLLTKKHHKKTILCDYEYNSQKHKLWLYNEKFVRQILIKNGMKIRKKFRFHIFSSLVYRIIKSEKISAPFSCLDILLTPFSYLLSHNVILYCTKTMMTSDS